MERKFRGKTLKSNEWVYGYYVKARGHHYILQEYDSNGYDERWETSEWVEVDPKTVGQVTPIKDKNGKEAYAGDLLKDEDGITYCLQWGSVGVGVDWGWVLKLIDDSDEPRIYNLIGVSGMIITGNIHEKQKQ